MYLTVMLTVLHSALTTGNTFLHECAKYYHPRNYIDLLPHLNMPFIDRLPIPSDLVVKNKAYLSKNQHIHPTAVVTTKVISVQTKYVYKNPVCVKYSRKQKFCATKNVKNKESLDKLVTKDSFVKHTKNIETRVSTVDSEENENDENDIDSMENDQFNLRVSFSKLESSEDDDSDGSRSLKNPVGLSQIQTPALPAENINDLLIEDRLDQLETILPGYTRRRVYETRTLYVTKTISNRRSMATLLVKNCVPLGYDICPKKDRHGNKNKKRKKERSSKVARVPINSKEKNFYYG